MILYYSLSTSSCSDVCHPRENGFKCCCCCCIKPFNG